MSWYRRAQAGGEAGEAGSSGTAQGTVMGPGSPAPSTAAQMASVRELVMGNMMPKFIAALATNMNSTVNVWSQQMIANMRDQGVDVTQADTQNMLYGIMSEIGMSVFRVRSNNVTNTIKSSARANTIMNTWFGHVQRGIQATEDQAKGTSTTTNTREISSLPQNLPVVNVQTPARPT